MSYCLSNLSISPPISSRFPHSRCPPISGGAPPRITVKAAADDGRGNLDQLQRQNNNLQQQPKSRTASVAPIATGLWSQFPTARSVQQMMETMERMMDDPFTYWPSPPPPADYGRGRMPWEIKEGEAAYHLRFDMPGMTKEDVKVWVEEKMLVVKAEKLSEKKGENTGEEKGGEWSEKSYGKYSSRIALPENVEFEKIKAEVRDGVLYITIPKASRDAKVFDVTVG